MSKKVIQCFLAFVLVLLPQMSNAENIISITNSCDQDLIDQATKLDTKNAELYQYFTGFKLAGCYKQIELSDERFIEITHYFAKLGNPAALYSVNSDMNALLASARSGNIGAQAFFILKNTNYTSFGEANTADITIDIPNEEYQQYLDNTLEYALKGDVRAFLPAFVHSLSAKYSSYSVLGRFNTAKELISKYGKYNSFYNFAYGMWKVNSFDYTPCISKESDETDVRLSNFKPLCGLFFNYDLYNDLKSKTKSQRLRSFRDYINNASLLEPEVESEIVAYSWLKFAQNLGVYALFDIPYSKGLMPYALYRPDKFSRDYIMASVHWIKKYNCTHKTEDECMFANLLMFSSENYHTQNMEPLNNYFIDSIPFIKRINAINHLFIGNAENALNLFEKQLFEDGDIDAIRYMIFIHDSISKDKSKAVALLDIYSKYRPELVNTVLRRDPGLTFDDSAYDLKKVKEYKLEVESKLPKNASTTSTSLSWNKTVKPYLIMKLDELIEKSN